MYSRDYYINYKIPQIGKEFDLLKISKEFILNIELKSKVDQIEKIKAQQNKNYKYLKFLDRDVNIVTFDSQKSIFYEYDIKNEKTKIVEKERIIELISRCVINCENCEISLDELFKPKNYLVSPFNKTDEFLENKYVLTQQQEKIINEINKKDTQYNFIKGDAGTGKSLLIYDFAKKAGLKNTLIIHVGKLNSGHNKLNMNGFNIKAVRIIPKSNQDPLTSVIEASFVQENIRYIIIDESQRINAGQLKVIVEWVKKYNIKLICSYDLQQYLHNNETNFSVIKLYDFILKNAPEKLYNANLGKKIRTNKYLSAFVKCLYTPSKFDSFKNDIKAEIKFYVDIEFYGSTDDVEKTIKILEHDSWKYIRYTESNYNSQDRIKTANVESNSICVNSHDVIGQEFEKVVVVLDNNFFYKDGELCGSDSYYNCEMMLYENLTRAIGKIKIIIHDNLELYRIIYKLIYN